MRTECKWESAICALYALNIAASSRSGPNRWYACEFLWPGYTERRNLSYSSSKHCFLVMDTFEDSLIDLSVIVSIEKLVRFLIYSLYCMLISFYTFVNTTLLLICSLWAGYIVILLSPWGWWGDFLVQVGVKILNNAELHSVLSLKEYGTVTVP